MDVEVDVVVVVVVCVAEIVIQKIIYIYRLFYYYNTPKTGDIEKFNLLISGVVGIGVSAVVGMNSTSPIENKYSNKLSNIWYYNIGKWNCKPFFIEITKFYLS